MIERAQGILTSSGSIVKGLAGAHPLALGVMVGVGAYFAVNKYLLNDDEAEEVIEAEEELEESSEEDTATA